MIDVRSQSERLRGHQRPPSLTLAPTTRQAPYRVEEAEGGLTMTTTVA